MPLLRSRTLRGRVSRLGLGVIAAWLLVLTVGFNLYLAHRLRSQVDATLRIRAQAASATVAVDASGRVSVRESATDGDLDSDIWIYAGTTPIERPTAPGLELEKVADSLAGHYEQYRSIEDTARLYVLPVRTSGRTVATIVAALSTDGERRAEKTALAGSVIVSALLLAVAYPVMRLAVRRALDPVDAMARQAADWSAHQTSQRFGTGQQYAEMRGLARDLDGLLDRLSAVLRHERQLSGELSHELRTPLTRIAAEADLLVTSGHPGDRDAHLAIAETARTMDRIIDTLLEAARAEPSGLAGTGTLAAALDALPATESVHRSGDLDVVVGVDTALLERILAPVLDNARRYARDEIRVEASRSDDGVQIDITNDGPPIPSELADSVFAPGFRDEDGTHSGAGLGLALSRRLARAADGDIVCIASPDGATFRVTLPAG